MMCYYVADPARSLCVHRKTGSSGTATHPRSPTLHLSTLGFECFDQQRVYTSFPHGGGGSPMVEVSTDALNIGWGAHWNALMVWATTEKTLAGEAYGPDIPGCFRLLYRIVLHQQAGRNTVNTAVQTDKEITPHVSGQPNSAPGTTHSREIERSCRHPVAPCPDVRYRMVSAPICLLSTDTGMGNPLTRSVCNEVES